MKFTLEFLIRWVCSGLGLGYILNKFRLADDCWGLDCVCMGYNDAHQLKTSALCYHWAFFDQIFFFQLLYNIEWLEPACSTLLKLNVLVWCHNMVYSEIFPPHKIQLIFIGCQILNWHDFDTATELSLTIISLASPRVGSIKGIA